MFRGRDVGISILAYHVRWMLVVLNGWNARRSPGLYNALPRMKQDT